MFILMKGCYFPKTYRGTSPNSLLPFQLISDVVPSYSKLLHCLRIKSILYCLETENTALRQGWKIPIKWQYLCELLWWFCGHWQAKAEWVLSWWVMTPMGMVGARPGTHTMYVPFPLFASTQFLLTMLHYLSRHPRNVHWFACYQYI